MTRSVLVLLLSLLTLPQAACEPCAVVFGSHCQDRQREEDQDSDPPWWAHQRPPGQPPPFQPRG